MNSLTYLLIPLLFIGCKNVFPKREVPVISTEKIDTIQAIPPTISATPAKLETAFIKGTTHHKDLMQQESHAGS